MHLYASVTYKSQGRSEQGESGSTTTKSEERVRVLEGAAVMSHAPTPSFRVEN